MNLVADILTSRKHIHQMTAQIQQLNLTTDLNGWSHDRSRHEALLHKFYERVADSYETQQQLVNLLGEFSEVQKNVVCGAGLPKES